LISSGYENTPETTRNLRHGKAAAAPKKLKTSPRGENFQGRSCSQAGQQNRCGDHARPLEAVEAHCGGFGSHQGRQQNLLGNEEGGKH